MAARPKAAVPGQVRGGISDGFGGGRIQVSPGTSNLPRLRLSLMSRAWRGSEAREIAHRSRAAEGRPRKSRRTRPAATTSAPSATNETWIR
jgi:hypothetical protein